MTKLKLLRLIKGIKQAELAKRLNISRPYLSLIENDWSRPSEEIAERIARALEVEKNWLFKGEANVCDLERAIARLLEVVKTHQESKHPSPPPSSFLPPDAEDGGTYQ